MQSDEDSFFKTGTSFAILHTFGKVSFGKNLFISVVRRIEINFLIILRIFSGMLLRHVVLLFFNVLIMPHIGPGLKFLLKNYFHLGVLDIVRNLFQSEE